MQNYKFRMAVPTLQGSNATDALLGLKSSYYYVELFHTYL